MFRRMLEICEREDPAYTVLHQNATFTAKRKDIKWKASPSFAMDFRADNFATLRRPWRWLRRSSCSAKPHRRFR